jgi:hypothetical protein
MTEPITPRFASYKPKSKSTRVMSIPVECRSTSSVMSSPCVWISHRSIRAGLVGWLKIAVTTVSCFVDARSGLGKPSPRPISTGNRTKRRQTLSRNGELCF